MSLLSDLGTKIGTELKSLWNSVNGKLDKTGGAITGNISVSDSISAENGTIRIGDGFGTGGSSTIHKLNNDLYLQYNNGLAETNLRLGGGSTKVNLQTSTDGSTFKTVIDKDGGLYAYSGLSVIGTNSDAQTSEILISASAPQIKFNDTEAGEADFYIHINSNNFYILADRDSSDTWEDPHPLQLEADTNKGYMFGNEVLTTANGMTGNKTISTSAPSGGSHGDIWIQV